MIIDYLYLRKNSILYIITDLIFINIICDTYKANNQIFIIFIWILISYIVGKFHLKAVHFKYFLNSVILFFTSNIIFLLFLFATKSLFIDISNLDYKFILLCILNLLIFNILNFCLSLLNKEKVFLFIGSEKAYKELNKFINNTHKNKLIYFDNINRIYEYENLKRK